MRKMCLLIFTLTLTGPVMALTDYQLLVDGLVRDDTGQITVNDRDRAIQRAVLKYSEDRPREVVEDVASSAPRIVPLPAHWDAGFSGLQSIEYPVGSMPPDYLSAGAHGMYHHPAAGLQITLRDSIPIGATVRIAYTRTHTVDAAVDTPPVHHREPIANFAAALLLDQLATRYAGDSDSTIQADSVDHASKSRDFAARAGKYRGYYFTALGIQQNTVKPASATVNLDLPGTRLQRRRL